VCPGTYAVTVVPPAISGPSSVTCGGSSITLSSSLPGTWSSSNTGIATVTSGGVVTGVSDGTVTISCTAGGCIGTYAVTVVGPSISGSSSVCTGSAVTLGASIAGGTWSSSNSGIAGFLSGPSLFGYSAGAVTISYSISSGCVSTIPFTVYGIPTISGGTSICPAGTTTTLSPSIPGGTWSSSNTGIATVNASGVVSGVSDGSATISYTVNGCTGTLGITVYTPSISGGASSVCGSSTVTFTGNPPGGTWSSSNTAIANVSPSGVVSFGGTTGVATITYSIGGCNQTTSISAGPSPTINWGPSYVCSGNSLGVYTATPTGGLWSSSDYNLVIDSHSGTINSATPWPALSATYMVTYTTIGTCSGSWLLNVDATPTTTLWPGCAGGSGGCSSVAPCCWARSLNGAPSGGTWSSVNLDLTILPDGPPGVANASSAPSVDWLGVWISTSGSATYTVHYPDGNSCKIQWNFSE